MLRRARRLALVILVLSAGCAEPPSKEMNQAQGAIEAARAAGADRFAAAELAAAVDALKRSEEAVTADDYRLALNHAIDSFERAQNAAKMAVEARANARGDAERAISQVATLLATAQSQVKDSRLPARMAVQNAEKALQEARSALEIEDYAAVTKALEGVAAGLQAVLSPADAGSRPPPSRRKR